MEPYRFSLFAPPASSVRPLRTIGVLEAYNLITTSPRLQQNTDGLRAISEAKERRQFKVTHFPFATFSGEFTYRKADCLVQHSSLLCLDFDHVGPYKPSLPEGDAVARLRSRLVADPHFATMLAFRSPSGDGLKWVVALDLQRGSHVQWVQAVMRYVEATYGMQPDAQCKDIPRSCFLPHDGDCYLNPAFRQGTYADYCPF